MTTDFRALCAELAEKLDEFDRLLHGAQYVENPLTYRARAALAEPQPEPPTDEELMEVFWDHQNGLEEIWADDWLAAARAVLARWGS